VDIVLPLKKITKYLEKGRVPKQRVKVSFEICGKRGKENLWMQREGLAPGEEKLSTLRSCATIRNGKRDQIMKEGPDGEYDWHRKHYHSKETYQGGRAELRDKKRNAEEWGRNRTDKS